MVAQLALRLAHQNVMQVTILAPKGTKVPQPFHLQNASNYLDLWWPVRGIRFGISCVLLDFRVSLRALLFSSFISANIALFVDLLASARISLIACLSICCFRSRSTIMLEKCTISQVLEHANSTMHSGS